MNDILIMIIVSFGALFILLAAVGLLRMSDFYLRISVTTKAATLGVGLTLLGLAMYFTKTNITTNVFAIIIFLFLTAPISAHVIGRASYFVGVPLWKKTKIDEIKGKYDSSTHDLLSGFETEEELQEKGDKKEKPNQE
ncbi:MAG: monovalent cation/H(+) antiporter subunit G [Brumimicrobium sp.]